MADAWLFVMSVLDHWVVLVTGGVVTAVIIALEHWGKRSVHWRGYRWILLAFSLASVYLAWRDQHNAATESRREKAESEREAAELRKKLEAAAQEKSAPLGKEEEAARKADSRRVAELQQHITELTGRLEQREARRRNREGLGRFLVEGQVLMDRCLREGSKPPPQEEADAWATRVAAYLSQSGLDSSYVARFRTPPPPSPMAHSGVSAGHDRLWRGLVAHAAVLTQFIQELRE